MAKKVIFINDKVVMVGTGFLKPLILDAFSASSALSSSHSSSSASSLSSSSHSSSSHSSSSHSSSSHSSSSVSIILDSSVSSDSSSDSSASSSSHSSSSHSSSSHSSSSHSSSSHSSSSHSSSSHSSSSSDSLQHGGGPAAFILYRFTEEDIKNMQKEYSHLFNNKTDREKENILITLVTEGKLTADEAVALAIAEGLEFES